MSQGIYKRTKEHREGFAKNMHTVSANKKRQETMRRNRELVDKEKELAGKEKELVEKERIEDKNEFDHADNHITALDHEELSDTLVKTQHEILRKVKELAGNLKSLQNLQEKRDKIENRLAELGMRY